MVKRTKRINGPAKARFQISLSRQAARAGQKLAQAEHRTFSNMLEALIARAAESGKAVA